MTSTAQITDGRGLASEYSIMLKAQPANAAANSDDAITLTVLVTTQNPELSVDQLNVQFKIFEGDAYFPDNSQLLTMPTGPGGIASIPIQCGVAETGYALAILTFSDVDKLPSDEVRYTFVGPKPELSVEIDQVNAFADGQGRLVVKAYITENGVPAPEAHVLFRLSNSTAQFEGAPGETSIDLRTDDNGLAQAVLGASHTHTGFMRTSLVSDVTIRDTSDFTFLPAPKLTLTLKDDFALADGQSAITAIARVTDAESGAGIAGAQVQLGVSGPVTPVSEVDLLGGYVTYYTDEDGYTTLGFTSTTKSKFTDDMTQRLVIAIVPGSGGTTSFKASQIYTFR